MRGGVSAPASRTGWGQLNATPGEAICSYKTVYGGQEWRKCDDVKASLWTRQIICCWLDFLI